jgi:hypothetical protein
MAMPAHSSPQRWLSSISSHGSGEALVACPSVGCESKVAIANWNCPSLAEAGLLETAGTSEVAGTNATGDSFAFPWTIGFDDGFCDYDVSLANSDNGELHLTGDDFLHSSVPDFSAAPAIPIGKWFHIEVFPKRAADETGESVVYQDGAAIVRLSVMATDDSTWGQWYVGNLASNLEPVDSTLYLDDVAVSTTR